MKVLIVNAHPNNQTGRAKFDEFKCRLREVLKDTLFYGNDHEEHIRRHQQLSDLLYEEDSDFNDVKCLQRFRLYTHVIIDGEANIRPWNSSMKEVLLLIRMCVRENTRFVGCGFGCLALYLTLATTSEQAMNIGKEELGLRVNPATGDLLQQGKKVGNCGLHNNRHAAEAKSFVVKNHQLDKAVLLPTKMHYPCVAGLAGSAVLRTIKFPFALYCTNTWMCNPASYLKEHVDVLIETDAKLPIVFVRGNCIGIVNFSRQLMNVLANWIATTNEVLVGRQTLRRSETTTEDIHLDNELKKPLRSRPTTATISRTFTYASRPPSSSIYKSKQLPVEEAPVVRCSGPYLTQDEFYQQRLKASSRGALSRTYMRYDLKPDEHDIKNYVTRADSRPPSNYEFRTTDKTKWLAKKPFLLA